MIKPFLFLIGWTMMAGSACACINNYEKTDAYLQRPDPAEARARSSALEKKYKSNPTQEAANDYAVSLMYVGQHQKAIAILEKSEKAKPGAFRIASNLGTAYELSGNDAKALVWIKEGIKRNPNDHQGTEWLHVKILEAKLAARSSPDWLLKNRVLGIDFGTGPQPDMPFQLAVDFLGNKKNLPDMEIALKYQLTERLKFVNPPEPVVGDLFFAWGDLSYLLKMDTFTSHYESALRFGVKNSKLVEQRLEATRPGSAIPPQPRQSS
ncbi:hypothetical protein BH11PSE11_BH11PSE11_30230 [soil metagenome]